MDHKRVGQMMPFCVTLEEENQKSSDQWKIYIARARCKQYAWQKLFRKLFTSNVRKWDKLVWHNFQKSTLCGKWFQRKSRRCYRKRVTKNKTEENAIDMVISRNETVDSLVKVKIAEANKCPFANNK